MTTMIEITLLVIVLYVSYHMIRILISAIRRWWNPSYLTMQEEKFFEEALANANSEISEETRRRPDGFVATCVNDAKNEFGSLRRTRANQMMVHKFLRDRFRENKDFRPKNVQDQLPLAVEMVFTASDGELLAMKYRASKAAQDRESISTVRWFSLWVRDPVNLGFSDE